MSPIVNKQSLICSRLNEVISEENDDSCEDLATAELLKKDSKEPEVNLPEAVVPKVSRTGLYRFGYEHSMCA